ncbi:MAG TPA: hypothetical protein VJB97_04330 [Candidatus Paceibacterota bacterium]
MARKSTILGLTGWLPFQGRERLEQTLEALYDLHVREFRTVFSWADWEREGGEAWFNTVAKSLGEVPRLRVLPIFTATPQKRSMKDSRGARKSSYPPEELSSYAAFVRTMIDRYGDLFDTVELWREPNSRTHWEWKLDEDGARFAVMAMEAAKSARSLKKKIALGALSPLDLTYLSRMDAWGLLAHIDAVSFLYSPSTREREGYALGTRCAPCVRSYEVSGIPVKCGSAERALRHERITAQTKARMRRGRWNILMISADFRSTECTGPHCMIRRTVPRPDTGCCVSTAQKTAV